MDGSLAKTSDPSNDAEDFVFSENDFEFPALDCEVRAVVAAIFYLTLYQFAYERNYHIRRLPLNQ